MKEKVYRRSIHFDEHLLLILFIASKRTPLTQGEYTRYSNSGPFGNVNLPA